MSLSFLRDAVRADGMSTSDRMLAQLAHEIDTSVGSEAVDPEAYAPPDRRGWVPEVDMEALGNMIQRDPLGDLRARLHDLTYGDMMEFCGEVLALVADAPITMPNDLAKLLYRWSCSWSCSERDANDVSRCPD